MCLTGVSLTSSTSSSQTQPTMRTVPYSPTIATPRPALAPSSSRCQTPTRCSSATPEPSPHAVLFSSSVPAPHCRANSKELGQSGVDSSGYSSSEGTYRKPLPVTGKTSCTSSRSGTPSPAYRSRIRSAFYSLMGERFFLILCLSLCYERIIICLFWADSASVMAVVVHSKMLHLRDSGMLSVQVCTRLNSFIHFGQSFPVKCSLLPTFNVTGHYTLFSNTGMILFLKNVSCYFWLWFKKKSLQTNIISLPCS